MLKVLKLDSLFYHNSRPLLRDNIGLREEISMEKIEYGIKRITEVPHQLYHGTCKAFIVYALQRGGMFGPESSISFTPALDYSRIFAESWKESRGLQRLRDFFGESIDGAIGELCEPVILQFNAHDLGHLTYRMDCGGEEYFVERGPIDVHKGRLVDLAFGQKLY